MEDSAIFEPDLVLAGPGSTVLGGFPEYGMAAIGLTGLDCPANSRSIQGYSGEYFPAIYGHTLRLLLGAEPYRTPVLAYHALPCFDTVYHRSHAFLFLDYTGYLYPHMEMR